VAWRSLGGRAAAGGGRHLGVSLLAVTGMVQFVPRQPKLNFGQHMISTKIPGKLVLPLSGSEPIPNLN
jgi:hypothetical protein